MTTSRDQGVHYLLTHEEMVYYKASQLLHQIKNLVRTCLTTSCGIYILADYRPKSRPYWQEGNLDANSQLAYRMAEVTTFPPLHQSPKPPTPLTCCRGLTICSAKWQLCPAAATDTSLIPETDRRSPNDIPSSANGSEDRRYCRNHQRFGDKAKNIHQRDPAASSKTAATVVHGGRRLFHTTRPTIHHRPSQQPEIPGRNRI